MKKIVYLKNICNYKEIIRKNKGKIPDFLYKIIFLYKNFFNIIIKKEIEGNNIWLLPINNNYNEKKINKLINKIIKKDYLYVLSNDLIENKVHLKLRDKILKEENIKKIMILKALEYISNIQNIPVHNYEVSILVNDASEINLFLLEELAKKVKNLKIVSLKIYKFKNFEDKIYNEYGIAMQFSNSYRKSLEKSKIIINLDFDVVALNEYDIYDNAIIINASINNIKIKTKKFQGININSYNIKIKDNNIKQNFINSNLYDNFNKLTLYESKIVNENILNNTKKILSNIEIVNLIGNNGKIEKREFKNIRKTLDKYIKTE